MAENIVPEIIVDETDYREVIKKLDLIEEKLEFTNSEMQQRIGKRLGRDIGILYGICIGLIIVTMFLLVVVILGISPAEINGNADDTLLNAIINVLFK